MDPLILISIAIVALVLSVAVFVMLLRTLKTTGELRHTVADRAAKTQELEHLRAQLEQATEDASAAQDLRIEVGRLETELQAERDVSKRANESVESLQTRRDELQGQVQDLTGTASGLREQLKGANESIAATKTLNDDLEFKLAHQRQRAEAISIREGALKAELESAKELLVEREDMVKQAKDSFKVLSTQTLEQQQEAFMQTADANLKEREAAVKKLVDPLREQIERFGQQRSKSEGELGQQIKVLASETTGLASALRRPEVRGQWGEVQLERVLELSGLREGFDYTTQDSFTTADGRQRTDVIVRMPHDRTVVLDSKVSLSALMDASATDDPTEKSQHLGRHVLQVKHHVQSLSDKAYWKHLDNTPNVVVMVLPEFAFLAALECEPDLTEWALGKDVIVVTPPAVLALLRAVELNWQQVRVAETAEQIRQLGRQLHADIARYSDNFAQVGRGLRSAVNGYNSSVATFQSSVVRRSDKFQEFGLALTSEINELPEVMESVREFEALPTPEDDGVINGLAELEDHHAAIEDHESRTSLI